jgi:CheY-like chemotaxis protein
MIIAEDSEDDVFFFRRALEKSGLTTELIVAHNGEEAVKHLAKCDPALNSDCLPLPNLLLLDLNMPLLNGFDVLAWLKNRPQFNALPVVVFSSSNLEADVLRAKELGADEYAVKPNEPAELLGFVQKLHKRWISDPPSGPLPYRNANRMLEMPARASF